MTRKKLPLVVSAPHAASTVPKSFASRMLLSPEQIWKCSDPFTAETCQHPRASATHIATAHRLLCDLNRPPTPDTAFRVQDFYGNAVWKKGKELSQLEKTELLGLHWFPYFERVVGDIQRLFAAGHKKVLFIDHHNTAIDHPLGTGRDYMPSLIISNLGSRNRGARVKSRGGETSLPAAAMKIFQKSLSAHVGLSCEVNHIFRGGYGIKWVTEHGRVGHADRKVYAVQVEYNLNLIHNPLSGRNDHVALEKLRSGMNTAIDELADYLKLG